MQENKPLVIVGSGETALIAFEYFQYDSEYEVVAFSVNERYLDRERINGLPVVPFETLEQHYPPETCSVYIGVSSGRLNRNRTALFREAKAKGYACASYISSRAFVWRNVQIGENCFIFEDNTLQPFVTIGDNVILWSGNHIGHRSRIEDNCFISSHCVVSGFCTIGENSFLGVNCTIEDNTKIAKDNFIGAGALIQKDTEENGLYQTMQTGRSRVGARRLFHIKDSK